jgi:outer membrane protein TolC
MKHVLGLLLMVFAISGAWAQTQTFSLDEAIEYAMENSYMANDADMEVQKARRLVKKTLAQGFPQISASGNYTNNIQIPVQVVPAEAFGGAPGDFIELQFGTQQTMFWNANLDQLIFDGSYIIGVQGSEKYLEISKNINEKTKIELREIITQLYAQVLVTYDNYNVLVENVTNLEEIYEENRLLLENGFIEQEDLDQVEILLSQTRVQMDYMKQYREITEQQLKFNMGLSTQADVEFTTSLEEITNRSITASIDSSDFNYEYHIDYILSKDDLDRKRLERKLAQAKYLPSLRANLNFSQNSFSDDEFNFFNQNGQWFNASYVGLNVRVPIFTSFMTKNGVQEASIAYDQAALNTEKTEEELRLNKEKAIAEYNLALESYEVAMRNLELAKKINNREKTKYSEGLSSSLQLAQTQTQYLEQQNAYTRAIFNLVSAKSNMDKALNQTGK